MPDSKTASVTEKSLPSAIWHALDAADIAFSVHCTETIDPALHLHAVLVQHLNEQLLVIVPRTHILDLAQLNAITDRSWKAAANSSVFSLLTSYHLDNLATLPTLFNLQSVCDPAVFMQPVAYLDCGVSGLVIGLKAASLDTLFAASQRILCSEPIPSQPANNCSVASDVVEIQQAVVRLTSRRIHQRLQETLEIPVLSRTAKEVLRLRNEPLAGIDELAAVVETDPPLAAQVMSWAASPYYAAPGKIRSVEDAIVRVLGFELVINLALGLSLGKNLTLPNDQPQHCTPYWQQAIYTAALIEGLTRVMPIKKKPETGLAYLAGLLHNFGFALLAHVFPPYFSLVCRTLEVNLHLSHSTVEHHLLGVTREQMGAWLMQCWQVPDELVYALRYQDTPDYQGEYATYANLTCLAQRLLAQNKDGLTANNHIPESLYQRLGLNEDNAQLALQRVLGAEQALRALATQFNH